MTAGWPASLGDGPVGLRPIRRRDRNAWRDVRRRNAEWLRPWEATQPDPSAPSPTFGGMVHTLRSEARAGRVLPFIVTYDGRLAGQLTVGGITYGSLRGGHVGYWVDQALAGRGVIPTGVALAADHAFGVLHLHRLEISMRPENHASRRVAEKLGFRFEGTRPAFLHIDGEWRDHLVYALHAEEVPEGLLARWHSTRST
ncbi:MAG TPA: GNAT family protein [Actinomycetes bacterium]|nr:GNAT family protein [Actinomycetes bacterium]